jgi:Sec-independent protein translocase protein TatA
MIAFIGPSELTIAAFVGLLLFGGKLPEVMRQVGRVWFGFRRSLNDLKRETGLEDALRDIRRETGGIRDIANDFRDGMDPFANPAPKKWPPTDTEEAEDAEDVEVETTHKAWSSPTDTVADGDTLEPRTEAQANAGADISSAANKPSEDVGANDSPTSESEGGDENRCDDDGKKA